MAKNPGDDDPSQMLGDSQFELEAQDGKKPRPILFLAISLAFAVVLAMSVLYLTDSGPFEKPPTAVVIAPSGVTGAPADVAPPPPTQPASEPAALPLPKPAEVPKPAVVEPTPEPEPKTLKKSGKTSKKKAAAAKNKKKKKKR
jgi:periplasmic protein TonB